MQSTKYLSKWCEWRASFAAIFSWEQAKYFIIATEFSTLETQHAAGRFPQERNPVSGKKILLQDKKVNLTLFFHFSFFKKSRMKFTEVRIISVFQINSVSAFKTDWVCWTNSSCSFSCFTAQKSFCFSTNEAAPGEAVHCQSMNVDCCWCMSIR